MTSKISFYKLMKGGARYKSWLPALISLVLFMTLPAACLLSLDGLLSSVKEGFIEIDTVRRSYRAFVGFGNVTRTSVTAGCAFISAFTCFSYMNSRHKVDFYHSLPVNRRKLFLMEFLNGLLFYAVPCFVCSVICIIIGAVNSLLTGPIFLIAVESFLMQILYYLILYLTGILAAVLTGKIIVGLLAAAAFICYGPMLVFLITGLAEMSFKTLMPIGSSVMDDVMAYSSPLFLCLTTEDKLSHGDPVLFCIGFIILITVLLFFLCFWLFGKRASESAGHSIAFGKIERPLKFLLVIPCSLTAGLLLKMMSYSIIWFFAGIVFGAVILSALIEFIYRLDIREIFAHKILLAGTVLTSLLIAAGFYFDWIGYDSYIPDEDNIVSMSVYSNSINGSFYYGDGFNNSSSPDVRGLESLSVADFMPVYELAKDGIEQTKSSAAYGDNTTFVSVRYELLDGEEVFRNYFVGIEAFNNTLDELFKDMSFRDKFFPLLGRDNDEVRYMNLDSITGYNDLELTSQQKTELLNTYKEELREVTYETLRTEAALGTIGLTYENKEEEKEGQLAEALNTYNTMLQYSENYPVYPSFTGTIALLKEYGYPLDEKINASGVDSIRVTSYDPNLIRGDGAPAECILTSEAEISQLLPLLGNNNFQFALRMDNYAKMDFIICMKDGDEFSQGIKSEDVPQFVADALRAPFVQGY